MQNIENKVVVITGASSGLGAETARHLVQAGAKVVLGARRLDRLQVLEKELGLSAEAIVQPDVTNRLQVQVLVDHAVNTYGRIDVMLNNAGVMRAFYEHNAIPSDSFARCVLFAISQPEEVDINEILFRPTCQEF